MDYNAALQMSRPGFVRSRPPASRDDATGVQDAMWRISTIPNEIAEAGPYPERPGEQDCAYYLRTGLCRFGMTCRFNHPANRKLALAAARMKGVYPERFGQPECQYYLKTGTCKFGATCKFHHPRDKAGVAGRVLVNIYGYPLRPNEKECAYYLRTGQCKYGSTCKFHHPQPMSSVASLHGSAVYPPTHSPTTPGQQSNDSYPRGLGNWTLSRASFVPSPRWQGPSNHAQLLLPRGVMPVPGWNTYTGQLGSISSSDNQQQALAAGQYYGSQNEATSTGVQGMFSPYRSASAPVALFALQRENIFPERPDQPECQYYMKTGDCKFGAICRFHHPRERLIPPPNCVLSSVGLPLRPGEPLCSFYSHYGICKFGPTCKFDHPIPFSLPTPTTDAPVVRLLLGTSSGTPVIPISGEISGEVGSGKSRHLSQSESRQIPDDESTDEESHTA